MNKQRIKAFTIMEVTIAMLLAAIVIGITYTAFSIVSRSYSGFSHKNDQMAVLERLDELLKRDFSHADTILKIQNGLLFTNSSDSVKYELDSSFVVRTSTIIDTFKVQTQAINTLFENVPVTEVAPIEEQNRIDELQLTLWFENEKIPYHYHKDYSSANLIERNPNAVN